jgi:hypothetical protein
MQIDKPQPEKFVLCQKCNKILIKPGSICFCQTINNRNN